MLHRHFWVILRFGRMNIYNFSNMVQIEFWLSLSVLSSYKVGYKYFMHRSLIPMFCSWNLCWKYLRALLSVAASPNLWLKLLKYLKLDPNEFIRIFEDNIKKILIEEYDASPVIIFFLLLFQILRKCISLSQFHDWNYCVNWTVLRLMWPHFILIISVPVFRELSADNSVRESRHHSSTSRYVCDQTFKWYLYSACYWRWILHIPNAGRWTLWQERNIWVR